MNRLIVMLLLVLSMPLSAAEATGEPEVADEEQKTDEQTPENDQRTPAPAAGNLKNRNLGEAFKSFRPSEEISADNAVAFPVDI